MSKELNALIGTTYAEIKNIFYGLFYKTVCDVGARLLLFFLTTTTLRILSPNVGNATVQCLM